MYQLSQALSAGVMRKEDWKSIQNVLPHGHCLNLPEEQHPGDNCALKSVRKKIYGRHTSINEINAKHLNNHNFSEHLTEDKIWIKIKNIDDVYKNYSKLYMEFMMC